MRSADQNGRRTASRAGRLSGQARQTGRISRDLRTDRRPKRKQGPVERKVVRVVTPGTLTDAALLADRQDAYLLALCTVQNRSGGRAPLEHFSVRLHKEQ